MKHSWTILCRRGIVEQGSNQLSLIDVVERITLKKTEGLPEETTEPIWEAVAAGDDVLVPFPMQLTSYWTRSNRDEPETAQARLRLVGPTGKILSEFVLDVDLVDYVNRRSNMKAEHFPFAGEGVYRATVHMRPNPTARWRYCTEIFVDVAVDDNSAGTVGERS